MGWTSRFLVGLALVGAWSVASDAAAGPGRDVRRLTAASPGATVRPDRLRATVRFAHTPGGVVGHTATGMPASTARGFLRDYAGLHGLDDPDRELALVAIDTDTLGHTRVRFAQRYQSLPVYGSDVRVHFGPHGELVAAQTTTIPHPTLSTSPSLGRAEAEALALDTVPSAAATTSTELLVFDPGLLTRSAPDPRLAWAVEVVGPDTRATVFIDAHTGESLLAASHIHSVLDRATYNYDVSPANLVWQESDGPYTGGDLEMAGVIDFTEDTYDLFFAISGGTYPSFDAASATMIAVLYPDQIQCPNAQWDGVATGYCAGVTADDVVGHEWAHAYTEATQELIYAYQPGALNESYSDIFGETVDLTNGAGTDLPNDVRNVGECSGSGGSVRWLIGEDTTGLGGAIRDMWDPTCLSNPGRVGDFEYFCPSPGDFYDNGGVHFNSGVPNHTYALLVDGGGYNGQSITAIGLTKASAIYWRAETTYQGVLTDFADHADSIQAACSDLVAAGTDLPDPGTGMPSGEIMLDADCDAVLAAVTATEMYADSPCGTGTLLDTGDPPALCSDDTDGTDVFTEDFEGDLSAWTLTNAGVAPGYTPRDWELVTPLPDAEPGQAAFATGDLYIGDCTYDNQAGSMQLDSPEIALPDGATGHALSFRHWLASEPSMDGGNVKIAVNGGAFQSVPSSAFTFNAYNATLADSPNPMAGEDAFSGSNEGEPTGSWVYSTVDLAGIASAGDTLVLRFDFGVNECNGLFGWYVDDVRVVECGATGGTTGTTGGDTGTVDGSSGGNGTDSAGTSAGLDESTSAGNDAGASTTGVGNDTGTPPPPSGDTGGTATTGTSTGGDGNATSDPGGCGCHQSRPRPAAWLLLPLLLLTRRRTRRGIIGS